jgi:hypothetical protein
VLAAHGAARRPGYLFALVHSGQRHRRQLRHVLTHPALGHSQRLQGYLAVESLLLYKTNANLLGGGQPVLTGPTLVNRDNVDQMAPLAPLVPR